MRLIIGERAACRALQAASVPRRMPRARCCAPVTAQIKTGGQNVVKMRADWSRKLQVSGGSDAALSHYLQECPNYVNNYVLPMGAVLKVQPTQQGSWLLEVPRLEFMDVYVKPTADVRVHSRPGQVTISTNDCIIEASKQVQELGLQDRFDVDVNVRFTGTAGKQILATADLVLKVDVPFPFNLTPSAVFEAGGNLVVNSLVSGLMDPFSRSVVDHYEQWARQQQDIPARV